MNMEFKTCTKCEENKLVDNFYIAKNKYGSFYSSYCKECQKEYTRLRGRKYIRQNGLNSIESIRNWDREYQRLKRKNFPERKLQQNRDYYKNNPEKAKAHQKVFHALKSGKIDRKPCEICGSKKVQGHHPDYSKPLEVIWLCAIHHKLEHQKLTTI